MPATIRQVSSTNGQNNILAVHMRNVTSQSGEDGIIERIFEIMPVSDKWCVEFGAWDGKHWSNTFNLITNLGWSGVLIEADKEKFNELEAQYSGNTNVNCLQELVEFDGENTLDNLLANTIIPTEFDLLAIDVDGCDYHIWESVRHFTPKLVVIEFNPSVPNDIVFIQEKNSNVNHGNSLLALIELGREKGYELIATTNFNAFFVAKDYYSLFGIADNSIQKMRDEQPPATKIFQLYDGTLVTFGMRKLLWHDIEIGIDELQILPRSARSFHPNRPNID